MEKENKETDINMKRIQQWKEERMNVQRYNFGQGQGRRTIGRPKKHWREQL